MYVVFVTLKKKVNFYLGFRLYKFHLKDDTAKVLDCDLLLPPLTAKCTHESFTLKMMVSKGKGGGLR